MSEGLLIESFNFKVNINFDTILVDQRPDHNEEFHSKMTVVCVNLSRRSNSKSDSIQWFHKLKLIRLTENENVDEKNDIDVHKNDNNKIQIINCEYKFEPLILLQIWLSLSFVMPLVKKNIASLNESN